MLPLKLPSADFRPIRYRPDGIGNWSGHVPFACDLIHSAKPAVFVELGTYYGESYFAFCQAIAESGIACSAFAVDTWRGDTQTGPYGEDVFEEVDLHNRSNYAAFSRLLRMSFDEASKRFGAESIDVLHIDGFHTYDAVRRDFETWIPRLRPGGIVLLHDISVRSGDFGVWRLWSELQSLYPTFSFDHSNGLGVLMKSGSIQPDGILEILFHRACPSAIQAYYEICAERLWYRHLAEQADGREVRFTAQLFWTGEGEPFYEDRSVKRRFTVTREASRFEMLLPSLDSPPERLRLDFGTGAALLCAKSLRLMTAAGQEIWSLSGEAVDSLVMSGMHIGPGPEGVLILTHPGESSLILPAREGMEALAGGGAVVMELSSTSMAEEFGRVLNTGRRTLVERDEEIGRLRGLLAQAEATAAERGEQLSRLQSSLRERLLTSLRVAARKIAG